MPSKERLAIIASQVKSSADGADDEEYSLTGKFIGTENLDERVPQRFNKPRSIGFDGFSGRKDLTLERNQAVFDPRQMNYYIHGGKNIVELREKMLLQFERDPTFRLDDFYDMTKDQQRERVMTRLRSIIQFVNNESPNDFTLRLQLLILVDPGHLTRIAVHYGLFLNTIMGQGTPEQVSYWIGRGAADFKGIIGCYAMTELGHGSNVAGIETTAIFDHESDEFVIHSPSLTATKWWIGGAAESATHSTVFANLVVNGKRYGVKPFVVPLRDPQTFALLPGITIGDCGAKMGRNAIDNGWIQFTHVRIPRTNMLMRYTKVSSEGRVVEPPMAQLAYGALIFGRTAIIRESSECAKKATAIAVRYGCVRRQFGKNKNLEIKIMDYQTHQQRLIPLIAETYAMAFGAMEVGRIYENLMTMLEQTKPGDATMVKTIDALKETHATSAGLKAHCTWRTLNLIEQCRQSLGGLGYSSYAGLATLFQDFAVQCTWEGDNTVLTLQTGRYLISCVRERAKGKRLPDGVGYLNHIPAILTKTCSYNNLSDLPAIAEAFDVTCANLAVNAAKAYQDLLSKGVSEDEAQLQCGVQKSAAARLHCMGYLFNRFRDAVAKAPNNLTTVLTDLCKLHGLSGIKENAGSFLQFGYLKPSQMIDLDNKILELFTRLRSQLVPLTDAYGLTDYVINSPLGCYDGDVYQRMFERVKQSAPFGTHPYFERVIKPVLLRQDQSVDKIEMND